MKSKIFLTGCLVLVLIAVLVAGGVAFLFARIPPVSAQVLPENSAIQVTLTTPLSGSSIPLNAFTQINADAVGTIPLTKLEFWVDDQLIDTSYLPQGSKLTNASTFWSWTPAQPGDYILVVRAFDSADHFAYSNAVRVHADPSANLMTTKNYTVQAGDSLASLAQKNNTTAGAILGENPGLPADGMLPPGSSIKMPVPLPPVMASKSKGGTSTNPGGSASTTSPTSTPTTAPTAPTTPPGGPPASPSGPSAPSTGTGNSIPPGLKILKVGPASLDKNIYWIRTNVFDKLQNHSAVSIPSFSPSIQASLDVCNANLMLYSPANNADAYFLYRLDPLSTAYKLIAVLPPVGPDQVMSYVDLNLYGKFSYYFVMATGGVQLTSAIVTLNVNEPGCDQGQWPALVVTQAGMTTSKPMSGGVYCYLSLNDSPWGRIPDLSVLPFNQNGYDLVPYFPNITMAPMPATLKVTLECWGYSGTTLVSLGKDSKSINTTTLPVSITLSGTGFKIILVFGHGQPTGGAASAPSNLAPPSNLRGAQSVADCTGHITNPLAALLAGPICGEVTLRQYIVMVWEWQPLTCPGNGPACSWNNQVDGYRVYQVSSSGRTSLIEEKQGTDFKVEAWPRPALDLNGRLPCYIVRTFKGTVESVNSNLYCASSTTPGLASIRINPVDVHSQMNSNVSQSHAVYCTYPFPDIDSPQIIPSTDNTVKVGYSSLWDPGTEPLACPVSVNTFWRGVIAFDMGQVPGRPWEAVLSYNKVDPDNLNCGDSLNFASALDGNAVTEIQSIKVINPTTVHADDVSTPMRSWLISNSGLLVFSIDGSHEDLGAHLNGQCYYASYGNFSLDVLYLTQ